ncbi:MAG TPA: TVP38/TMEM64 family protein, partial [Nitrospirae bacterium]|nr:TVP38/TMEM64 family protein [Nitrospirota bacterium]
MNKKHVKKIIIVLVIILLIAVFKVFNLGEYFSLAYIKESQEKFDLLYAEH